MEKLELKKSFSLDEADLMATVSAVVGNNPHTFQSTSAYWAEVEVDFGLKIVYINGLNDKKINKLLPLIGDFKMELV